jgi:DNA-binding HxlR family transcriptional regulator
MYAHDAECLDRVASTIEVLRGKWTVQILCVLVDGPARLSRLRRLMPAASKKALTANLRACHQMSQMLVAARCMAARKLRAVLS